MTGSCMGGSGRKPRLGHKGSWLTLATLCTAVLITQVDTSVVNLAVRPIGRYFQANVGALQWMVDAYNLVYAVLLLTGGLLADLYGRRRVFMAGAIVFTGASLSAALAPSISVLIGARAVAGFGAALVLPASLASIRVTWPDPVERGRVLGIWAGCNGLAFAIGPVLGGALIAQHGWRSIFLVVVPLGAVAVVMAALSLAESSHSMGRRFDAYGQLTGACALGGLAAAAIEGRESPIVAATTLFVGLVAFAWFVRIERGTGDGALVPLALFRVSEFRGAMVATSGMTFGMYGVVFLVPLFWQSQGMLGPEDAGLALVPMAVTFLLVSSWSGALSARLGSRASIVGGVGTIGLGVMVVALTIGDPVLEPVEIGLILTGLGMGIATGPLMGSAVGSVTAGRSGTAASLINVARMVGATLGIAVLGALYAALGGGSQGISVALTLGAGVALASAGTAWMTHRTGIVPIRGHSD